MRAYQSGWTNERAENMSDERYDAEEALLAPLRLQHAQEIVLSGLAQRAITSSVTINNDMSHAPLNEGSDIMPIRKSISRLDMFTLRLLKEATGLAPNFESLMVPLAFQNDSSKQLILCRAEEVASEGYRVSPDVHHYTLGVQLSPTAARSYSSNQLVPVEGIRIEDLELVVRQMQEISDFAIKNDLISVDPATLIQCIGEPYYGPVNPYFNGE